MKKLDFQEVNMQNHVGFRSVVLASDHAGYVAKEVVLNYLNQNRATLSLNSIVDYGCFDGENRVDYPIYAKIVAKAMEGHDDVCGMLFCSSGVGMSIAANRYAHVRAAVCFDTRFAFLSRSHNNANLLVIAADAAYSNDIIIATVKTFLTTSFETSVPRYKKRVEML